MPEISKQQLVVYVAAAIAIALIGARYLRDSKSAQRAPGESSRAPRLAVTRHGQRLFVHVTGAVRHPGVYRLPPWARLDLAVRRAGGGTRAADLAGVNLAAKLSDGQQVVVPARAGTGAAAPGSPAASAAGGEAQGPISLNSATLEQLDTLEGVGPATAQKILDWRAQHGGFGSVDDLKQISGIGPKRFEALKDKVRV
jgi:competence protein ComEA